MRRRAALPRVVPLRAALWAALLASAFSPALAHEPLWGETPTIFGPGVWHPEIRLGSVRRGSVDEPGDERMDEIEGMVGLQYGINRFVNVRLTVPMTRATVEENLGGTVGESSFSGVGDALIEGKYRFHLVQETGLQKSQAVLLGWKLPTGEDDATGPDGARLPPSQQPGSGRHGLELGWAIDQERLVDTWWACAFYMHDFGSGFREGDMAEVTAAYGRWLVRPNVADELGLNLALGIHARGGGDDRLEDGSSADNSYRLAGLHLTPIVSFGRSQYRIGVFVPLVRSGDELSTDFSYEVRMGWEMFF
jgi:hypothetical protein